MSGFRFGLSVSPFLHCTALKAVCAPPPGMVM